MHKSQEPKYAAAGDKLINRATGEPIPDDEPVFVLRAKDLHAVDTLQHYRTLITDSAHRAAVTKRIDDFIAFRCSNAHRMKVPDTAAEAAAS